MTEAELVPETHSAGAACMWQQACYGRQGGVGCGSTPPDAVGHITAQSMQLAAGEKLPYAASYGWSKAVCMSYDTARPQRCSTQTRHAAAPNLGTIWYQITTCKRHCHKIFLT